MRRANRAKGHGEPTGNRLIRDAARASCSRLRLLAANAAAAVELLDHDAAGNDSIERGALGDILLVRPAHDGRLRVRSC